MANIKKVIKALEKCTTLPCYCKDCEYQKDCYLDGEPLMKDALELLKNQQHQIESLKKTVKEQRKSVKNKFEWISTKDKRPTYDDLNRKRILL